MSEPGHPRYNALAHGVALIIWARCVDHGDGAPVFEHLNENGFDVPADILTRLGVMEERRPGAHAFTRAWRPGSPLRPTRRDTAPTIFDLIIALAFLLDWDQSDAPPRGEASTVAPPPPDMPDMTDARRFRGAAQIRFHRYALSVGAEALSPFGLCYWDGEDRLRVVHASGDVEPCDLLDLYQHTRAHVMARGG